MNVITSRAIGVWIVLAGALLAATSITAESHPGSVESDCCHFCRTNCAEWEVAENERHCHGVPSERPENSDEDSNEDSNEDSTLESLDSVAPEE